jgi:hypothetical protein
VVPFGIFPWTAKLQLFLSLLDERQKKDMAQ